LYLIGGIKVDEIELIRDLIDKTEKLPHRNEGELDSLIRTAKMRIRKIFGDSSTYLNDLEKIYYSCFAGIDENVTDESWSEGQGKMLNLFKTMEEDLTLNANKIIKKDKTKLYNEIFIVHGHDEEMKQAVARTVEKIGLVPIILHEQPNKGRTIIEKFEDYSDVNFAIVILSPDDIAYPKDKPPENKRFRARQNVIFELGFFVGKLERKHVLILFREEENFEIPSDYLNICYTPYDNKGQWRFDLIGELNSCGYNVDANKLIGK
jgi:predicted nucleotide-binding protein